MIFVGTNYFLRSLVQPSNATDRQMAEEAQSLFRAVQEGEEEITTSEAVIAEVVYTLSAKHHYHLPAPDVAERLKPFLLLPKLRLPSKRNVLRALDLWSSRPALGFVDA